MRQLSVVKVKLHQGCEGWMGAGSCETVSRSWPATLPKHDSLCAAVRQSRRLCDFRCGIALWTVCHVLSEQEQSNGGSSSRCRRGQDARAAKATSSGDGSKACGRRLHNRQHISHPTICTSSGKHTRALNGGTLPARSRNEGNAEERVHDCLQRDRDEDAATE